MPWNDDDWLNGLLFYGDKVDIWNVGEGDDCLQHWI